jgi:hypothetical protein
MRLVSKMMPSPSMVVALVALVVALGGVAAASIPGPDGVIQACVSQGGGFLQTPPGTIRVIDSGASCDPDEIPLALNQPPPASQMPTVYSERSQQGTMVGAKPTPVFTETLPAGSYEVTGHLQITQPNELKAAQRAECSVLDPANQVVEDSTVAQTLPAGSGEDTADLDIDTVVATMPQGTLTISCEDIPEAGAAVASRSRARTAQSAAAQGKAESSPGVVTGNVVQAPIEVPVNVCGNTINVVGSLNPAGGNVCVNH